MESNPKDTINVPKSIGIIIDGNRRWAKEHGLSSFEGHKRGYEMVKTMCGWAHDAGVQEIIIYGFSTENWNRKKEEVEYIMDILADVLDNQMQELYEQNARVRFIGDRARFSESLQRKMSEVENRTKDGTNGTVVFALSYGGRLENTLCGESSLERGKRGCDGG